MEGLAAPGTDHRRDGEVLREGDRPHEPAGGPEHASDFRHRIGSVVLIDVLEHLRGDDDIEAVIFEGDRLKDPHPRHEPLLGDAGYGLGVGVENRHHPSGPGQTALEVAVTHAHGEHPSGATETGGSQASHGLETWDRPFEHGPVVVLVVRPDPIFRWTVTHGRSAP